MGDDTLTLLIRDHMPHGKESFSDIGAQLPAYACEASLIPKSPRSASRSYLLEPI
jgi:hypothetical protein